MDFHPCGFHIIMNQRQPVWKIQKRLKQKKQRNQNKINKTKKKYKNTTKNTKDNRQQLKIKTQDENKKTKS